MTKHPFAPFHIFRHHHSPTTEGDEFMGWIGDTYDTMPTHDLIYTANIVNGIENSELNTQNSIIIYDLYGLGDGRRGSRSASRWCCC